jgi:hypothetical protein
MFGRRHEANGVVWALPGGAFSLSVMSESWVGAYDHGHVKDEDDEPSLFDPGCWVCGGGGNSEATI